LIAIDFIGSIAGLAIIIGIDANDEANDILLYTGVVIFGYFVSTWLYKKIYNKIKNEIFKFKKMRFLNLF
jgi:hypothetical protein